MKGRNSTSCAGGGDKYLRVSATSPSAIYVRFTTTIYFYLFGVGGATSNRAPFSNSCFTMASQAFTCASTPPIENEGSARRSNLRSSILQYLPNPGVQLLQVSKVNGMNMMRLLTLTQQQLLPQQDLQQPNCRSMTRHPAAEPSEHTCSCACISPIAGSRGCAVPACAET